MQLVHLSRSIPTNDYVAKLRQSLLMLFAVVLLLLVTVAQSSAETRTLRMYYGHSKESATITFKRNGKYIKSGLRKANRFLRDWRRKEPTRMDPALLDLVWEVYQKSGSRKPIQVISGYRSPRTNKMLRRRGRRVARKSQHTLGKALDFFLPDVSVNKLRALGLKAHRGGVGYYRGSFVHLDTGKVRHWPRMSRRQLSRVFPRGKTIHVPRDGRKMKRYNVALANLKRGRNADGSSRRTPLRRSLLAKLFKPSGGNTEGDESKIVAKKAEVKKKAVKVAKAEKPKPVARAKTKGVDPFSQDSTAVSKADKKRIAEEKRVAEEKKKLQAEQKLAEKAKKKLEEQRKREAAEESKAIALAEAKAQELVKAEERAKAEALAKRVAEATQIAALTPAKVPTPNLRPSVAPANQLSLAASEPKIRPNVLEPVGATELALATPAAVRLSPANPVLRPSANIPEPATQVLKVKSDPKPVKKPSTTQIAALSPAETKPTTVLVPSTGNTPLRKTNIDIASLTELPKPAWRSRPTDNSTSAKQKKKISTPIALPSLKQPAKRPQSVVAVNSGAAPEVSELKLGNLDGRAVKKWAVAVSTRTGSTAELTAPAYRQGTSRAAPLSVYSGGFAFDRSPLRADRFSGRSLTRVAFAHFSKD